MSITEFQGDPVYDLIAKHWPERNDGWQMRIGDLVREMHDEEMLVADVGDGDWF
jgi:hypothetical protein